MLEDATREAESGDREDVLATVRFHLVLLTEWMGDYATAIAHAEQVIEIGRRLRLPHLVVWPNWFVGKSLCCLGEYGPAVARLEEALGFCERIGDRAWRGRLLNTLGWCLAEIGDLERARDANTRALAVATEIGDAEILANARINLAGNHLGLGDSARAEAVLAPVEERLATPGDPWTRWRYGMHASNVRGRIGWRASPSAPARSPFRRSRGPNGTPLRRWRLAPGTSREPRCWPSSDGTRPRRASASRLPSRGGSRTRARRGSRRVISPS